MKTYKIRIGISQEDAEELMSGRTFNWTYPDEENPDVQIKVQLVGEEDDMEDDETSG